MNNYNDISVVVDNNVIMDLFELKRLDILFQAFKEVNIPQIIYNEEIIDEVKLELEKYQFKLSRIDSEIGMQM